MLVLDTCAIIWDALDQKQLSEKALTAINLAEQKKSILISDISIWEIAMLASKGRISLKTSVSRFIDLYLKVRQIKVVKISPEIAEVSTSFGADINKDPADRIICALSLIHKAPLVTADNNLIQSQIVETLW